jgi:hypothetical protein
MEIDSFNSLNEIKNIIASSEITRRIVAAKIDLTFEAPNAKIVMVRIRFQDLAKGAVSINSFPRPNQIASTASNIIFYLIEILLGR